MKNSSKTFRCIALLSTFVCTVTHSQTKDEGSHPHLKNNICNAEWIQTYNHELEKIGNEVNLSDLSTKWKEATLDAIQKTKNYFDCRETTNKLYAILMGGEICTSEKQIMDLSNSARDDISNKILVLQRITILKVDLLKQKYSICGIIKREEK